MNIVSTYLIGNIWKNILFICDMRMRWHSYSFNMARATMNIAVQAVYKSKVTLMSHFWWYVLLTLRRMQVRRLTVLKSITNHLG